MEPDIKPKTAWVLAGKVALGIVCVIVTILSLSRLGGDQWRMLLEWLSDLGRNSPLDFAIVAAGVVNIFLLFGLYLWGDKRTRRVLLPMCILMLLQMALFPWIILFAIPLNLILLLALIPCAIEASARKKTLLGIAAAFCAFYLLAGMYACYVFWSGFDFPRQ